MGRYLELDPVLFPRVVWFEDGFVQAKPMVETTARSPEEVAWYSYAKGNPLRYDDPSGEGIISRIKCVYYLYKCSKDIQKCRDKAPACDPEKNPNQNYSLGGLSREQLRGCMKDSPCIENMLKACAGAS